MHGDRAKRKARGEGEHSDEWRETAFIGGWTVYATREEVDELSEHVVTWLRARRKPEAERTPDTPLVYVTYRALPQTPTADEENNN